MSMMFGHHKPTDEEKAIAKRLRDDKDWTEAHDEWFSDQLKKGRIDEIVLHELSAGDKDEVEGYIRYLQSQNKEVLGPRFLGEKNLTDLRAVLRVCWDRHMRKQEHIRRKAMMVPKPKTTTASTSTSSTKKQALSKQSSTYTQYVAQCRKKAILAEACLAEQAKTTTPSTSTSSKKKQSSSKQSSNTSHADNIDASESSTTSEKSKKKKSNNSSSSNSQRRTVKNNKNQSQSSTNRSESTASANNKSKSKDASAASSKSKSKDASAASSKSKTIAGDANFAASQSGKDALGPTVSTKTNTKKKSKASKATVTSSEPGKDTTGSTATSANTNTKFQSDRDARAAARAARRESANDATDFAHAAACAARRVISNNASESKTKTETKADTKSKKKSKPNNASDASSKSGKDPTGSKATTKTDTKSSPELPFALSGDDFVSESSPLRPQTNGVGDDYLLLPSLFDCESPQRIRQFLFRSPPRPKPRSKTDDVGDGYLSGYFDASSPPRPKPQSKSNNARWFGFGSSPRPTRNNNDRKNPPSDTENIAPNNNSSNNNGSNKKIGNNKTGSSKSGSNKTSGNNTTGSNTSGSDRAALKDMKAKLNAEVAAHNNTKQELEAKLKDEVAAHNNTKQESEAKLEVEVAAHNTTKQELEAKLKAEVAAHNKTKLEGEVAARNNKKEEPEGEVASHNNMKEEMEAKLKAEVAAHNNTKEELAEEIKQHNTTKEDLATCQREKSAINGLHQQLQQQHQSLEAEISNLRLPFQQYNVSPEDCIYQSYNHVRTLKSNGIHGISFHPFDSSSPVVVVGHFEVKDEGIWRPLFVALISSGSTHNENLLYARYDATNPQTPAVPPSLDSVFFTLYLGTITSVSSYYSDDGKSCLELTRQFERTKQFHLRSRDDVCEHWATTIQFLKLKMRYAGRALPLRC